MNVLPMTDVQREHMMQQVHILASGGCFMTWCPLCGKDGKLYVTQVTISATGSTVNLHSRLDSDGFEVPSLTFFSSTDNERVKCEECGGTFGLDRVTIRL